LGDYSNIPQELKTPMHGVSVFSAPKPLPSAAAIKQRRHRLKQFEQSGKAPKYNFCRECGKPIKESYRRGFCPGGACRDAFFKKVQVTHFVRLDIADQELSQQVLSDSERSRDVFVG
jgi:hypothetical protein